MIEIFSEDDGQEAFFFKDPITTDDNIVKDRIQLHNRFLFFTDYKWQCYIKLIEINKFLL